MYYIWEIGKVAVPTDFTARRALAHTVSRALNEPTQDLLPRPLGTPRYLRYASDMESELLISPTPRPPDRSIYALVLMLCPHFSRRAAASPARV